MQEDGSLSLDEALRAWEERMARRALEAPPPVVPQGARVPPVPPQQQIRLRPEDLARLAPSRRGGPRG